MAAAAPATAEIQRGLRPGREQERELRLQQAGRNARRLFKTNSDSVRRNRAPISIIHFAAGSPNRVPQAAPASA